ncbi:haloacid dehalogenase-like hydrolase [Ilyonectria destructans]|nr:haloacid dehalogenase-like hydrolase [Ilyonectria destructans]
MMQQRTLFFDVRFRARGIHPNLLGCCWLEVAEREYTYLSMSGRYVVFFKKQAFREGAAECISKLRDITPAKGYFSRGGVNMPIESILSYDTAGLAKPTSEAYEPILKRLSADGSKPWFTAAHLWDASTAKTVGFDAAYCTTLKGEALPDIFGQVDIFADTLPDMVGKMIAASSS